MRCSRFGAWKNQAAHISETIQFHDLDREIRGVGSTLCQPVSSEKYSPRVQRTLGVRCLALDSGKDTKVLKRQRMGVRCISGSGGHFGEWIEAQIGGDPLVMRWRRSYFVALPAAESHGANPQ